MTLYEFLLGSQPILDAMGHLAGRVRGDETRARAAAVSMTRGVESKLCIARPAAQLQCIRLGEVK